VPKRILKEIRNNNGSPYPNSFCDPENGGLTNAEHNNGGHSNAGSHNGHNQNGGGFLGTEPSSGTGQPDAGEVLGHTEQNGHRLTTASVKINMVTGILLALS